MCLCPLPVKNNKLNFNPSKDPLYNYVPCGNCFECRKLYADGYVTRLLAHYNYYKSKNLPVFYFTLTYDRFHLPRYKNLVCFNKKHLQDFFKRLRKFYKFTYFVTAEYGDNTHRPHYHTLVFLSHCVCSKEFVKTCQKAWFNGNVYFGLNSGRVLDNRPMFYCSKYLTKSTDDCFHINKIHDFDMKDFVDNAVPLGFSFRCFHLQSNGLGSSLLSYLKTKDYINGYVTFLDTSCKSIRLPLPLYLYRKKCYDTYINSNGNISYQLNKFGFSIFKQKINHSVNKLFDNVSSLISSLRHNINDFDDLKLLVPTFAVDEFISRLTPSYLLEFCRWKLLYNRFDFVDFSFSDFSKDCDHLLKYLDLPDFVYSDSVIRYYHPYHNDFVILDKVFIKLSNKLKYSNYVENQKKLSSLQCLKSLKTGVKKSVIIEDFITFQNILKLNLCLITFLNFKKHFKEVPLSVDSKFSALV